MDHPDAARSTPSDGRLADRPTVYLVRPTTQNIGNDLIALGLRLMLEQISPGGINLVTLPARRDQGGGLTAQTVYKMNRTAVGVIVGAGNLFENGGLDVDAQALRALDVPLSIVSMSSGRVYGVDGRLVPRTDHLAPELVRLLCERAAPALVRDQATSTYLDALGVTDHVVAGCPSMLLGSLRPAAAAPELADCVLLSIRHPERMSVPPRLQAWTHRSLPSLAEGLSELGPVTLMCHDPVDLEFAAAFPSLPMRYTEDAPTALGWLASCRLAVGFRLHGAVTRLSFGKQVVHLGYDERGMSLLHTIGAGTSDVNIVESDDPLAAAIGAAKLALDDQRDVRETDAWRSVRSALESGLGTFVQHARERVSRRSFDDDDL